MLYYIIIVVCNYYSYYYYHYYYYYCPPAPWHWPSQDAPGASAQATCSGPVGAEWAIVAKVTNVVEIL